MERQIKKIDIFKEKDKCCACEACINICPRKAIILKEDGQGFLYPSVDVNECIDCGLCKKVCSYQFPIKLNIVKKVYAAASKEKKIIMNSASGGIFAEMAYTVIQSGGIVFGAAMVKKDDMLEVQHISIQKVSELSMLQGSKYVQSRVGETYKEAEYFLKEGREVLYSGTPCQIAGLKKYLRVDYKNLITIDIICHGVPSEQFFQDYLLNLKKSVDDNIIDFKFRDKTKGWGLTAKYSYVTEKGKNKIKLIPFKASSYYSMFINCEIYRENCYNCPYACEKRVGDITLGDYWGIQNQHPNLMKDFGGIYSEEKGISCILVNTGIGEKVIEQIRESVYLNESTLKKVVQENHQLKYPSKKPNTRDEIMLLYETKGYKAVEERFQRENGLRILYYYIKNAIPKSIKKNVKKFIKRG